MGRNYLARGCRGHLVLRLQRGLLAQECAPPPLVRFVDGDFGGRTAEAVRQFQQREGLPVTELVDERTWTGATRSPLPGLFERVLQLTADFEGHGFSLAQGNFDGAGITWGIIGFTLAGGSMAQVMREVDQRQPGAVDAAFAGLAPQWRELLAAPTARQLAWADSVSLGLQKARLQPAWAQAFERLGAMPVVQSVQVDAARILYYEPALHSARELKLSTERGVALCFDTHVQSGGIRTAVYKAAKGISAGAPQEARMGVLADAIADAVTRARYREDVRRRRRCIALGEGEVHGVRYQLDAWGLALEAAR